MTYKFALTGPSSSGKSTILKELAALGYNTLEEIPRRVLDELPGASIEKRQYEMLMRQIKAERALTGKRPVILDRGLQDIIAFSEYYLRHIPGYAALWAEKLRHRYDGVFYIQPSSGRFNKHGRVEADAETATEIAHLIKEIYKRDGHMVITVPNEKTPECAAKTIDAIIRSLVE